jgi:K+-transporting ATPase ATPase C chain
MNYVQGDIALPAASAARVQRSYVGHVRPALTLIVVFTILTGIAFPLGFVGLGGAVFPFQAGGSILERGGVPVGSLLIGENFATDAYFHPRPSATTETDPKDATKTIAVPYAADNSAASNLGPTSKALVDRVTADVAKLGGRDVPADAVTTSASGLDPDISPAFARLQVARVAAARKLPADQVRALVDQNTSPPLIGQPRVNVLALNLALDAAGK